MVGDAGFRGGVTRGVAVKAAIAGLGGFVVIFALAELTRLSDALLLIAPFGASCVLVFGLPNSSLARPKNVIGGHLVSTIVGLGVFAILGASPLAFGIGVGCAIAAMLLTDTTHPPAGADPIVVILAGASWPFLFVPVLIEAILIVVLAIGYRRLTEWVLSRIPIPAAGAEGVGKEQRFEFEPAAAADPQRGWRSMLSLSGSYFQDDAKRAFPLIKADADDPFGLSYGRLDRQSRRLHRYLRLLRQL